MSVTRYSIAASIFLAFLGLAIFFSSRASTTFASAHQASQAPLTSAPVATVIPTDGGPFGVAVDATHAQVLVTADYSNTVDVISTSTLTVTKQIPVGFKPYYIVPWTGTTKYLIGNSNYPTGTPGGSATVSVLDSTTDTVTATWGPYTTTASSSLFGIAVNPKASLVNTRIYLADFGTNAVYAVDGNGALQASLTDPSFVGPYGLSFVPTTDMLYVTNEMTDTVSVVNTTSMSTPAPTITVGANPRAIVYDPANSRVYVANGDGSISVIDGNPADAAYNTVVATIDLGSTSQPKQLALDAAHNRLYVTTYSLGDLFAIDTTNNTVVGTGIPVGNNPLGVDIDSGANVAYVANTSDNTVSVVNFLLLTQTPTAVPPTVTNTPSATASPTNTSTVTASPTVTPSPSATASLTRTPIVTASPTGTPSPKASSTATPTSDATPPSTAGQMEPRIYLPAVGN